MALNKTTALPVDRELVQIVKQKQYEQAIIRNRPVSLTELSNEIVKKGLQVMEDEKIKATIRYKDGEEWKSEKEGFKMGTNNESNSGKI